RLRDAFLSAAAHELRTPLTSLRGYAELTMERIAEGRIRDVREVSDALQVIDRQVDRLSNLVAQLMDISRLETGELRLERRMVDLVPLTRSVVEAMQAGTTRHHLSLDAPESLVAYVDPLRLQEVLYSLLDNAIRYSPRGGPVEVTLSTPGPDTVRIAVRDHGIGVPPEQRGQLFTRFFQAARRPAGGLGLGLYASRSIVELHGGRIWAEFPEDGGSRFLVELPRLSGEAPAADGQDRGR
ncbi:MAG: HAMP domain-containing sensor histidine kinase, partial [Anaerolineae bacterium]|nr:HAMP domain-containing sensor histidine kinase [Anaerolineae bacterium]